MVEMVTFYKIISTTDDIGEKLFSSKYLSYPVKAIGVGSRVNFSCEAQIKAPVSGLLALFTECQIFTPSRK